MCQSMVDIQPTAAEIRRGKKKKKIEDRKKLQGKNIMVCPITYGDHNKLDGWMDENERKRRAMGAMSAVQNVLPTSTTFLR